MYFHPPFLCVKMVERLFTQTYPRPLFQIFTQSIHAIDVTRVTLGCLNSINATDVTRIIPFTLDCRMSNFQWQMLNVKCQMSKRMELQTWGGKHLFFGQKSYGFGEYPPLLTKFSAKKGGGVDGEKKTTFLFVFYSFFRNYIESF